MWLKMFHGDADIVHHDDLNSYYGDYDADE